ncbi:lytic transglycosylase, partial [Enterobacter hormaechei]|nr:lytic transglycosylase [Enterobacter hormaechei]
GNPPATPPVPPGNRPSPGGAPGWASGWGQQGMGVLGSGLNAMGPVGGIFNNALRSGLSGGAGAGLMGLVGGLAALGVGKLIGAIANKIDKAQDTAIGMDKIYRQIGGIASYRNIKSAVHGVSDQLGMDVSEGIGLGSAWARASNLRRGDNLASGMLLAGGMARTYGLDPNTTAGVMGSFRGANIARNDQDTRRIGLVIGETIAKSNAFAKADELMQAVSQFAVSQARQSLTAPNIAGYGGAMSSLMGMNLPGLDVSGSAALISRVNAALMGGGAMGDASQMLTARVGASYGMNPFQLRQMREAGMFATKGEVLGGNGDQSFFSMTRDTLRRNYRAGSDDYYLAMANHLGTTIAQARALDQMDTGQLSGASARMSKLGLDLSKVNATSIGTIGQIESGRGLGNLAQGYLNAKGKEALSDSERKDLQSAINGDNAEKLKDVLTGIASKHGTVQTEGSQIRDGIAELNNTMTRIADNALPALNVMRMALVKMTGGSESALRKAYETSEREDRVAEIGKKYKPRFDLVNERIKALQAKGVGLQDKEGYAELTKLNNEREYWASRQGLEIEDARKQAHKMAYDTPSGTEASGQTGGSDISNSAAVANAEANGNTGTNQGAYTSAGSGNVGNVRDAKTGEFRRFGSAREGMSAMAGQLLRYQTKAKWGHKKTLRQIIGTYAPKSENNTRQYVSEVASWTGINPDSEIDLRDHDTMQKVMQAMIRKESKYGPAAAAGHYDEAIGDAMRNPNNFSREYPSEIRLQVDVQGALGSAKAEHTLRPYQQQRAWRNR